MQIKPGIHRLRREGEQRNAYKRYCKQKQGNTIGLQKEIGGKKNTKCITWLGTNKQHEKQMCFSCKYMTNANTEQFSLSLYDQQRQRQG